MTRQIKTQTTVICLTLFFCISLNIAADVEKYAPEVSKQPTVEELVAKIQEIWHANKGPNITSETQKSLKDTLSQLTQMGDSALPAFKTLLDKNDSALAEIFLRALKDIPGEKSAMFLIAVWFEHKNETISRCGLKNLSRKSLREKTLVIHLSDVQYERCIKNINDDDIYIAIDMIPFLARVSDRPLELRISLIMNRFIAEVKKPHTLRQTGQSYIPSPYFQYHFLMNAMHIYGETIWPYVHKAYENTSNETTKKWLVLLLGYLEDPTVAEQLKAICQQEEDRYIRSLAITAYARSAKEKAIPYLETLLNDPTESEYGEEAAIGHPVKLIADEARSELNKIKSAMAGETK